MTREKILNKLYAMEQLADELKSRCYEMRKELRDVYPGARPKGDRRRKEFELINHLRKNLNYGKENCNRLSDHR